MARQPRSNPADATKGPGRCFPFWQEVLACYVVNTSSEDDSGKKKCVPVLEDYHECLHHRKEVWIEAPSQTLLRDLADQGGHLFVGCSGVKPSNGLQEGASCFA